MKTVIQQYVETSARATRPAGAARWVVSFAAGVLTAAVVAAVLHAVPATMARNGAADQTAVNPGMLVAVTQPSTTAPTVSATAPSAVPASAPATIPAPVTAIPTYTARRQALDVTIPLRGECRAVRNVELRNSLESPTTILWVAPEGTRVKEGDVVMRLATTGLRDRIQEARIRLQDVTAARTAAQMALVIQQMDNGSSLKAAQAGTESAGMEYEQFDKGAALVEADTLKIALANAQTDLERKIKDRKAAEELALKGFVPDNDLLDARTAERDARQKVDAQKKNLEIWTRLTEPRQRKVLQRKCDQAAADLELTQKKNEASLAIKQMDLRARDFALAVVDEQLAELERDLANCTIKAPAAGLLLYPSPEDGGAAVAAGAAVGPDQVVLRVADTAQMHVVTFVGEEAIGRVHAGQSVLVTIDALTGQVLHGKVQTVAAFPDSTKRHAATGAKAYRTQIELADAPADLKPDMSARVQILSNHLENVIAVPQHAVFHEDGQAYVYVGSAEDFSRRDVKTGLASTSHVQIVDGLRPGEHVLPARPPVPAATETAERMTAAGGAEN